MQVHDPSSKSRELVINMKNQTHLSNDGAAFSMARVLTDDQQQ